MTTDTELRELLAKAEKERDSAQEHLAYHLADYQLNSEPTGDLAVDMAAWAGRQHARAERAEAEVARLRDTMRRSPQMSRVWQAEEETELLREGIKAFFDPMTGTRWQRTEALRSLLQEGE